MKIINRYILKEILSYFLIALAVFTTILLTLRMLKFTSLIVNRGVELNQIALVFISIVPSFLEIAIPLATLIGIMLAFGRLSGDSEIIVLRASGISISQLVKPVLMFGTITTLITLAIAIFISPRGIQLLSSTLFEVARSRSTAGLDPGVFNKLGNMTIYSEQIEHESGSLRRVLIDDKRNREQRRIVLAQTGEIISDPEAQTITIRLYDGEIHERNAANYVLTRFDTNAVVLAPDEILDPNAGNRGKNPKELTFSEIQIERQKYEEALAQVKVLDEAPLEVLTQIAQATGIPSPMGKKELKRKIRRLDIEGQRRIAMPVATFFLAILALPLGVYPPRSQRTWGVGLSATLGLFIFVAYYGLLSLGMALSENGTVPAFIGLWIPNILTAALAISVLRNVASERWQSALHGFDAIAKSITYFVKRGMAPAR